MWRFGTEQDGKVCGMIAVTDSSKDRGETGFPSTSSSRPRAVFNNINKKYNEKLCEIFCSTLISILLDNNIWTEFMKIYFDVPTEV